MTAWLEDEDKFPGNAAAFQKMKGLIASGDAVAFVGAGASAPLYPVWSQFLNEMLDNAVANEFDTASAARLRKQLDKGDR